MWQAQRSGAAWDVFVAYASPDRGRARGLVDALRAVGLRVCFDDDVLEPGDDWHLLLPGYVGAAAIVVVLVSSHTGDAHYQRSEVIAAVEIVRREGRRLVPVRLEPGVPLPYGTVQLQAIDMFDDDDIADAARRISSLAHQGQQVESRPSDQVFCDRVPLVSRFFAGRDELLSRVGESLRDGQATVVTQAIQGLGGVGKTTVAAALAHSRRGDLAIVWWVRAEDPDRLAADLAELAPYVGVPVLDDPVQTARRVRLQLESTARSWLLVFDNVPNERAVEKWVPRRGRGSVLITSRNATFPLAERVVRIDTFPPDVAARFLRHRVERDNPMAATEDLGPIIERLGGLPLALEHAGAWVAKVPNRRFGRFVELYDDAARDPFPDGTQPSGYDHTATTTWRVSLQAAAAEASSAERVMAVLSFFAPEDFPCGWLRDMGDDVYFEDGGADAISEALDALHVYSLATITPNDTVSVHRVIQSATRRSAAAGAAGAAIRTLRRKCPDDPYGHYSMWATLATLAPHAITVAETATTALPESAHDLCLVLDSLSIHQSSSGSVRDALTTATTATDIATTHLGDEHPVTLLCRQRIASAHSSAGDVKGAITLYEDLLADCERVLGNDDSATLDLRNSLAGGYQFAGDMDRAIALHEANLADRERVLGHDHLHTLVSRNNLANAYQMANDPDRALPLAEAAAADHERLLGPDHPMTFFTRNNLARAYQLGGDLDRAVALFEANLADRQRVLADDHPATLHSCNALATAYQAAGDFDRAVALFKRNLADRQRVLGGDHPHTLDSCDALAGAYQAAGDLGRAVALFERNLADRRRVLGGDHRKTLISYTNLEHARSAASEAARNSPARPPD